MITAAQYRALLASKAKKRASNKANKPAQPNPPRLVEKGMVGEATGQKLVVIVETFGLVTVTHMIPAANLDVIAKVQAEKNKQHEKKD